MKITRLYDELTFNRNYNNKPAFKKNNSGNKINKFNISSNDMKYAKKLKKSKNKKLFKSQNLAKSGKRLLKNKNSSNFGIKKIKLNFLTSNTKTAFNYL